jgi:large repetitive protein
LSNDGSLGIYSANIIYSGNGTGAKRVDKDWINVVCLAFPFDDAKADCIDIRLKSTTDFPVSGLTEIVFNPLSSGGYDELEFKDGYVNTHATICLQGLCGNVIMAKPDYYNVAYNTLYSNNALLNDIKLGKLKMKSTPITQPQHGSISFNTNGDFSYTPTNGFVGKDSTQYEVCDSVNICAKTWIYFNIQNSAILANNDYKLLTYNTSGSGSLISNDVPSTGITIKSNPIKNTQNGTATINANGMYNYTPNNGFFGTDSLQYEICNASNVCSRAWLFISVLNPKAPYAIRDYNTTLSGISVNGNALSNDIIATADASGAVLTAKTTFLVNALNGTMTIAANGAYSYMPNAGFVGKDSAKYEICNGVNICTTEWIVITVNAANAGVLAVRDLQNTTMNVAVNGNVLSNDIPSTGLTVKLTSLTQPFHGSINISTSGAYTYTPASGYVGKDSIQYEACNSSNVCSKARLVINTTGPNPQANRDVYSANINTNISGNLLTNDTPSGGLILNINLLSNPKKGGISISSNGLFTYTPSNGFVGKDSLQYEVTNGNGVKSSAWAVFSITGPAPLAVRDTFTGAMNAAITGNILTNDTPTGGVQVIISPFPTPLHGGLTLSSNGAFTYTPANGYVGKDSIQYEITDANSLKSKAWAVFTVTGSPVQAVRDTFTGSVNAQILGNVLTNDTPTGGVTVIINPFPTPLHGGLTLSSNGSFIYTPTNGYVGKDSIQYEITDVNGIKSKAWSVFTVNGPNPVAQNDLVTTPKGISITKNVLTNDTPVGGVTINTTPKTQPKNGTASISPNGNIQYMPNANFVGKDSVQYEISDPNGVKSTAWLLVEVTNPTPVNKAPTPQNDAFGGNQITGNVKLNDTDPDGNPLTVTTTPVVAPQNGTLTLYPDGTFSYIPNAGFVGTDLFQYEVCDNGNPKLCSKAIVTLTVTAPVSTEADLSLTKTVNQKKVAIGDLVTYTITVKNESQDAATGVTVKDMMPAGVLYQTNATAFGTYNNATGIWNIGTIPAGQTVTLLISVKVLGQGTFFNRAEVYTMDGTDPDSKPGNSAQTPAQNGGKSPLLEDDYATTCFYVPVEMCDGSGDEFDISVPTGYSQIQWYKNGTAIQGATNATLRISTPGQYTFTTFEGTCPAGGCCPAEFVMVSCCKPAVCVPYSVIKTKSGKK